MSDDEKHRIAGMVTSPTGAAYRGRAGCRNETCWRDGNPDRCYGWHCLYCDGPSNSQGNCSNAECPAREDGRLAAIVAETTRSFKHPGEAVEALERINALARANPREKGET